MLIALNGTFRAVVTEQNATLEVEPTGQCGRVANKSDETSLRPKNLRRQYVENQAR